jgi:hypothetical protein
MNFGPPSFKRDDAAAKVDDQIGFAVLVGLVAPAGKRRLFGVEAGSGMFRKSGMHGGAESVVTFEEPAAQEEPGSGAWLWHPSRVRILFVGVRGWPSRTGPTAGERTATHGYVLSSRWDDASPGPTIPPLPAGLQLHDVLNAAELEFRPRGPESTGYGGVKVVADWLRPGRRFRLFRRYAQR